MQLPVPAHALVPRRYWGDVEAAQDVDRSGDAAPVVHLYGAWRLPLRKAYDSLVIVDSAIYVDGRRAAEPRSLQETYDACRNQRGVAWIGLYKPSHEEFSSVAGEFGLHPLAVEDAVNAHQRPKLERYGETLFVVRQEADEGEHHGELEVYAPGEHAQQYRGGEERRDLEYPLRQVHGAPARAARLGFGVALTGWPSPWSIVGLS